MTANQVRDDWSRWQARLTELAQRHRVPGAALAVLVDGEVLEAATGVLNVETGVEATTDSLFQIGSITKVYTTSLIMQLVDQGEIDLDEPVVKRLEEFQLADPEAARQITTRHLLTHSSGIEGDHFVDTGRGDDAIARYVASAAELPMSHPVGATCSYCNTGFVVAGRMVEQLTGLPWHEALRTRLLDPLGLKHTTGLPEEAIRFRVAFGHDVENGHQVVGHDGGTLGQTSFLRLVPDAGVAVALLTNGGNTHDLYEDLYRELLDTLCGIGIPDPLSPPAEPVAVDLARYVGTYERVANRIELTESDGGLAAKIIITGPIAKLVDDPVTECTLVPVAEDLFVTRPGDEETWTPVVFYALPDGTRYLHMGARATPLVTAG